MVHLHHHAAARVQPAERHVVHQLQRGTQAVRVALPDRHVTSIFASIFGVTTRTVASAASAGYGGLGAGCVLCIMGTPAGQDGDIVAAGGDPGNTSVTLSGLTSDPTYRGFALWTYRGLWPTSLLWLSEDTGALNRFK
jgi:hypothetical protein